MSRQNGPLAFINVIGAISYLNVWDGMVLGDGMTTLDLHAEYSNIISAVYYFVITVIITNMPKSFLAYQFALAMTVISSIIFFIESIYYWRSWYLSTRIDPQPNRGISIWDIYFWANFLNVLPASLYMVDAVGSIVGFTGAPTSAAGRQVRLNFRSIGKI